MEINKKTLLKDILAEYPWLKKELLDYNPKFALLDSPLGKVFLRKATIEDLSKKAGRTTEHLIKRLNQMIANHQEKETNV